MKKCSKCGQSLWKHDPRQAKSYRERAYEALETVVSLIDQLLEDRNGTNPV